MHNPHKGQPYLTAGPNLAEADAVVVLVHGRGGSAEDMLTLQGTLDVPGLAAVAPQATGRTWYPNSFLAPLATNQPFLDSALSQLEHLLEELEARGFPRQRVGILGFSQGACLTLEFVARNTVRYGAVMGLTGGLIGPPGTERAYAGSLAGTPVFLGTSDPDPHVPYARVEETRNVLQGMHAEVEMRRYAGMPHTINDDELEACRMLLRKLVKAG